MPLPENFSEWENLQSALIRVQNRIVREEFSDITDDDDITAPRGQLKRACLHDDSDNALISILRLWFFYIILRKAQDLQAPLYGIPVQSYQDQFTFVPQCTLYFRQDLDAAPDQYEPMRSQLTFRITGETSQSFTEANARTLANQIKVELATGTPYRWNRGRVYCCYTDREHGYQLQIYAFNEAEGREVVRKVLSIRNHPFNDDFFRYTKSDAEFPMNPGVQFIYGKSRRKPRKRPVGYVKFRYATLKLHGLPRDICLVDTTGRYRDALVKVD